MNIKNIEDLDFGSLTSKEAADLGINVVFLEEDGTYDWIYCLKMFRNLSLFKFVMKIVSLIYVIILVAMLIFARGNADVLLVLGILGLVFATVIVIVLFSFWLVDKIYKGNYMLVYEMNEEGITFSQTTDQAQITRTIAAASATVSAAGGNAGGVISGTGLAIRPGSYRAEFAKVKSVKGKRSENLIWVNSFLQYLMVYVSDEAYDFVWTYITERCVNAKIIS